MSGGLPGSSEAMRAEFPAMNGPDAVDLDAPEAARVRVGERTWLDRLLRRPAPPAVDAASRVTDYGCAAHALYMAFAWSVAEAAWSATLRAAMAHGVGIYDCSGDGAILRTRAELGARVP